MITYQTDYALLPDDVIEAIGALRIALIGSTDYQSVQISFDDIRAWGCSTAIHVRVHDES